MRNFIRAVACIEASVFLGLRAESLIDNPFEADMDADLIDTYEAWDAGRVWDDTVEEFGDTLKALPNEKSKDLDIDPESPCKADLLSHPECNYGQDKGVCLWMNAVDSGRWATRFGNTEWLRPISLECKSHLVEFLSNASSHPFEYFKDLRVECDSVLNSFCANATLQQTALACLRSNFDSIDSSNCRDEITHLNSWTSLNASWWSPTLWRDCTQERKTVCVNSTSSGLSHLRDCLDDHRESLTDQCHHSLFESDLQAAPNPYVLRRDLAAQCAAESKEYCSDVVRGDENQLFCLYRASKRYGDRFNPTCASQVESVVKLLESDYRMNVPIRKFCRKTINEFCASEKDENDKSAHESDEVLSCLKRVYLHDEHNKRSRLAKGPTAWRDYEETEACMHAVRQSVLIDSLDWEVDSSLHSNCYKDYHRFLLAKTCEGESLQSPQECLQSHFSAITNKDCQKAVALHSQLSALDQDFKPQLLSACALALDRLDCSAYEESEEHHVGKDGLVECLYSKVHEIEDANCRAAVRQDFALSDRDYRLSYELSLVCKRDRVQLCSNVQPEEVLGCMISHIDDIQDQQCHRDVARLSFVAMNEGNDSVEKSACAGDVQKLCSAIVQAHGNVHACLLGNLGELSDSCSRAVLNLHTSAASHQAMEKLLNTACSEVLVSETCEHLIKGDSGLQAKTDCIGDVLSDGEVSVSSACRSQLYAVNALLSADYRTNPELQKDCKLDTSVLCSSELERGQSTQGFSTEVIQCLVQQRMKIRNSNCKKQILRQIYKMSEDVMVNPEMHASCKGDLKTFCEGIKPGEGRLHDCLREHIQDLSHDCQAQEFAVEQMEQLAASTKTACEPELTSMFCKGSGKPLHCLWRNVDESSTDCQRAVKREMKGKIGNIWLDPNLYVKCRSSVNELISSGDADKCPSHLVQLPPPHNGMIPLPVNYTQAIAGEHVACLGSNRAKIADRPCLTAVEDILKLEISDPLLLRFGLRSACSKELKLNGICGNSDPFDTLDQWKCLQREVKKSELAKAMSLNCADSVKRMWRLSLFDIKFNPDLNANCEFEQTTVCKGMSSSKMVVCLADQFARNATVFSEECGEAVKRMPAPGSLDSEKSWKKIQDQIEMTPAPKLDEIDDLPVVEQLRLLRQAGISTSDSGIEISGPLAFVSLSSLVVLVLGGLYRLYRYKMNKGYMVIVEKD
jgi:hypothetical protein